MKKYCIETLNKIMSNKISKYYSTFFKIEKDDKMGRRGRRPLQVPKSNSAITLIALIITIIVLLILAGVTLNMVMGENGIFGKANNAKNKTEVAQYEEELRMCVLEIQTDAATNKTTLNMDTIRKNLVEKVKELENTEEIEITSPEGNATIEGTYKGYEYKIDEKYVVHIGDKATGISLTTSINPSGWTQGPVTATITIKSNNGINNVEPDEGSKNGNEYIITKTDIAENTSFEYTVTDGQGNTQTKIAVINTIDKNPPEDFTITAENTEEGLKITGEATDAESGIDRYEYYVKKDTETEYSNKGINNPITGLTKGIYDIKVIAYDKAQNGKTSNEIKNFEVKKPIKSANITAQDIYESPEDYYGKEVSNYISKNGISDWKIFYSNNENIYLITSDYVDVTDGNGNVDTTKLSSGYLSLVSGSKVRVKFSNYVPFYTISDDVNNLMFPNDRYELNSSYYNSSSSSLLLNYNLWSNYKDEKDDNKQKALFAIGGPTISIWCKSWSSFYTNKIIYPVYYSGDKGTMIYAEYKNSKAYEMSLNETNELYFLKNSLNKKDDTSLSGYWIASPSGYEVSAKPKDYKYGTLMYKITSANEEIGIASYKNSGYNGLRPVVCLKKDVTVDVK